MVHFTPAQILNLSDGRGGRGTTSFVCSRLVPINKFLDFKWSAELLVTSLKTSLRAVLISVNVSPLIVKMVEGRKLSRWCNSPKCYTWQCFKRAKF